MSEDGASGLSFEDTGFIGSQIIRLYRFMHRSGPDRGAAAPLRWRLRRLLDRAGISALADFLYTYGIGGSLTRVDQLTFARYHAMEGRAYRLTLLNSVCFGIPAAGLYFAAGEGFEHLAKLNSAAEIPSLVVAHLSFGMGLINAAVHLFRIVDSAFRRRCWAPFGAIPLVINLPTYLKTAKRKLSARQSGPPDCDC